MKKKNYHQYRIIALQDCFKVNKKQREDQVKIIYKYHYQSRTNMLNLNKRPATRVQIIAKKQA